LKHIQILNLDIISKLNNSDTIYKYKNCLILPSLYFVKNAKKISYFNKIQLKENIFIAEMNDNTNNYIFKFNKEYFKAIEIGNITKKYHKYYILEDILININIEDGEIFKINNSFIIYQDNNYIEIPNEYIERTEIKNIDIEKIVIKNFKQNSINYIDILIYKHLKENYKNIFSKYITYLSLIAFTLSFYFINQIIIKTINNNKTNNIIKNNHLKNNISYLRSIKSDIKNYKKTIENNSKFINNIRINKNWKTLNIDVENKKFKVEEK
jgi:hypothetical protein